MRHPNDLPPLAALGQRLVAYLIDSALSALVIFLAFGLAAWCSSAQDSVSTAIIPIVIVMVGWSIYMIDMVRSTGQTPGKKVLGIKIINIKSITAEQDIDIGISNIFVREIIVKNFIGSATLGVALSVPLFTDLQRGLQDYLASTLVVKADDYEKWIYWMRKEKRQLKLDQELEQWRVEEQTKQEAQLRATRKREIEQIIQDDRAAREGINRLRTKWGMKGTVTEEENRKQAEERAERELRKRLERAIGLKQPDEEEEHEARERRVRERHDQSQKECLATKRRQRERDIETREGRVRELHERRERESLVREIMESEDAARKIREQRIQELHEQRERERVVRVRMQNEDEARKARERRVRELHEQREREKIRRDQA